MGIISFITYIGIIQADVFAINILYTRPSITQSTGFTEDKIHGQFDFPIGRIIDLSE